MLIQKKLGTLDRFELRGRSIDVLMLEWFETNKRILHKRTRLGTNVVIRFLNDRPQLSENDVLFEDEQRILKVEILPCDTIVVTPDSPYQLAALCYEIGNKHLPLYLDGNEVLIPFDEPIFRLLKAGSYNPVRSFRKLLLPLQSTVQPHEHRGGTGLLTRILKMTNNAGNE